MSSCRAEVARTVSDKLHRQAERHARVAAAQAQAIAIAERQQLACVYLLYTQQANALFLAHAMSHVSRVQFARVTTHTCMVCETSICRCVPCNAVAVLWKQNGRGKGAQT